MLSIRALLFSIVIAANTSGCAGAATPSAADSVAQAKPHSAIIFIPGFYGSALKDAKTGDRFFITASNFLFGSEAVSLHTRDLETPAAPDLVLDGVLEKVRIVPWVYTEDVYGRFLQDLAKIARNTNQELVPFAYDWRQDLVETTHLLKLKIDELHARGIDHVEIVAHSMGCLITAYYLAYGDQDPSAAKLNWFGTLRVKHAVLMAGPYRGAFSLFRNMQTGARIGSNTTYMPAETVASLPSSYDLLPFEDFKLLDEHGRREEFPVSDAGEWQRLQLGLLKNTSVRPEVRERRRNYVALQLSRAQAFSQKILAPNAVPNAALPAPNDLKILQIIGHGHPVVACAYYQKKSGRFSFDTDDLKSQGLSGQALFEDGDGSVTTESAQLPPMLRSHSRTLQTELVHERIFEDVAFQTELANFLSD